MSGRIFYFGLATAAIALGILEFYWSRTRNNPNAVPFRWRPVENRSPSFYYQSRTHHLIDAVILLLLGICGLAWGVWRSCTPRQVSPGRHPSAVHASPISNTSDRDAGGPGGLAATDPLSRGPEGAR